MSSLRPSRSRWSLPLAVALLAALCASPAEADPFYWAPPGDGAFEDVSSWSPYPLGPPDANDEAFFELPDPHCVTFSSSHTNQATAVRDGSYTFLLGGNTYTLTAAPSVVVGYTEGFWPCLDLWGGTVAGEEGRIAIAPGGSGTVTVGAIAQPATWTNSAGLYVGGSQVAAGGTGLLTVQNSGLVNAGSLLKVWDAGTVQVTSLGKLVAGGPAPGVNGSLTIGSNAAAQLSIVGGGSVSNTNGYLGYSSGSTGTATVDGAGSTWKNFDLWVGWFGAGTLNVQNGGSVSNTNGYLGYSSGSTGTATVDGAGSNWTNAHLCVGWSGAGTLNVLNGGTVSCSGTLTVNQAGGTGTLNVLNGGTVSNSNGYLGMSGGMSTATVDGAGSKWTNSGDLAVGAVGPGMLIVQNGGLVSARDGYVGQSGPGRGTATVDGAGSMWANSADLYIGWYGVGTLNVLNGGTVSNTNGYVGMSGVMSAATVDGAGSLWSISDSLYVGGDASAASGIGNVTVSNGGEVRVGGTLKVWQRGTLSLNAGGLVVADVVEVVPGATFNTQAGSLLRVNALSGFGDHPSFGGALQFGHGGGGGSGGYTLGAGQSLSVAEGLVVGYDAPGTLTVQNGGTVSSTTGFLGQSSTGDGTATVDGAGSTWTNTGSLYVGGSASAAGGTGSVTVSSGGELSVGDLLKLWPGGTLNIQNGTVTAGALSGAGTLNFPGGTLNITGPAGLAIGPGEFFGSGLTPTSSQAFNVTNAMQVAPGATLTLAPGSNFTAGSLSNAGTTLVLEPTISIGSGGVSNTGTLGVYASGFNFGPGAVSNTGALGVYASGVDFGAGGVSNAGTINVLAPAVNFGGGLTNTGNAIFMGTTVDGTVYTPTGSTVTVLNTVTFNDLVSGAGTFWGPGTTVFNGGYSPGDSPAITSFEGNVILGPTNQLIMELAGFDPGTGYDQVNILGDLALGGQLEVFVDRAFRDLIQSTDTFTLIEAAGEVTGEFLNVAPGGRLQSEDLLSEFTVYYGPGSPYGAQFVVLGNAAAIPEPATLTLLALGGLGLLARRRRRAQ